MPDSFAELRDLILSILPNATVELDDPSGRVVVTDTGYALDVREIDAAPSELVGDDLDNAPVVDHNLI